MLSPDFQEGQEEALTTTTFAPPVDVYEDEHNITLKIEVPGIEEKDIDVRIENNTLTVHGERKFEKEEKEENYRRVGASVALPAPSLCLSPLIRCRFKLTTTRAC